MDQEMFTVETTLDRFVAWLREETSALTISGDRLYNVIVDRNAKSGKVILRLGASTFGLDNNMLGIVIELMPLMPVEMPIQVRAICERSEAMPSFKWLMSRIRDVWNINKLSSTNKITSTKKKTPSTNKQNVERDAQIYADKLKGKPHKEIAAEHSFSVRRSKQIVKEQAGFHQTEAASNDTEKEV